MGKHTLDCTCQSNI